MNSNPDEIPDRRKVSEEGREQYAEFSRERADVEERLRLVDIQAKVIEHVTNPARQ
jgi:hypothetical protein